MASDAMLSPPSLLSKIGYGILLPEIVFIAWQFVLIGATSGTGSWDGMSLFFGSLFIVPGLLVANGWVLPIRWRRRNLIFPAGMLIPALIGTTEYLWLFGPTDIRWAINSVFVAPFLWIWALVALLFLPLLISIACALRRASGNKT